MNIDLAQRHPRLDDRLERPLPGRSSYNMNFIDWENEWEQVGELNEEDLEVDWNSYWELEQVCLFLLLLMQDANCQNFSRLNLFSNCSMKTD